MLTLGLCTQEDYDKAEGTLLLNIQKWTYIEQYLNTPGATLDMVRAGVLICSLGAVGALVVYGSCATSSCAVVCNAYRRDGPEAG
jgi:hypothetical protein